MFWIFNLPTIFVILFSGTKVQINRNLIYLLRELSRKLFIMRLTRKAGIKHIFAGLVEATLSLRGQGVANGQFWIESFGKVAGVIVGVFEGLVIFGLG